MININQNPPKRILALDGGGIRGILTLGYLEVIEKMLRERFKNPDFLLCDYFDLIGGTSTGSIIASTLALGWPVDRIKEVYFELGDKIFVKHWGGWMPKWLGMLMGDRYSTKNLEAQLQNFFGDISLGGDELKTALCIVAKRADTQSTWVLHNNPKGKYFDSDNGNNKAIKLRDAVRASSAAPTYFQPIVVEAGGGLAGAFVDGGVSMANNPALQLFYLATLSGYRFNWPTGEDKMMICSLGTGYSEDVNLPSKVMDFIISDWASKITDWLMKDATAQNQLILQSLSNSPTAVHIDGEIGNLDKDCVSGNPLFWYLRYNQCLEAEPVKKLGFDLPPKKVSSLKEMDLAENRGILYEIGKKSAEAQIKASHFPSDFDI